MSLLISKELYDRVKGFIQVEREYRDKLYDKTRTRYSDSQDFDAWAFQARKVDGMNEILKILEKGYVVYE